MNNFCANLCANGQWIYLEKNGAQWVRRSGLNIYQIASQPRQKERLREAAGEARKTEKCDLRGAA